MGEDALLERLFSSTDTTPWNGVDSVDHKLAADCVQPLLPAAALPLDLAPAEANCDMLMHQYWPPGALVRGEFKARVEHMSDGEGGNPINMEVSDAVQYRNRAG